MTTDERFYRIQDEHGWSWCSGYNPNYGGYYCQAWCDLPEPRKVDGHVVWRNCIIEGGDTIREAKEKLLQRVEQLLEQGT
jgi:hypothetical protein